MATQSLDVNLIEKLWKIFGNKVMKFTAKQNDRLMMSVRLVRE